MDSAATSPAPVRRIGIASPISVPEEVEQLAAHGATEFYCGVAPESWTRRYGDLAWLNRRGGGVANPNLATLGRLLAEAGRRSIPVAVALNAPYYTASQLPEVVDLCRQLGDLGASGLIISDLGLILALREAGSTIPISASSVAALRNSGASRFFRDLGVKRIILPRHMSIDEIRTIKERVEGVELEVFVLNDGCAYEEGFCATTHAAGAFCLTEWSYQFARLDGAALEDEEREALDRNVANYREWIWYISNCGRSFSPRMLPNGPCGLCAIWDFCAIGVDCLKIVGREAHPQRKLLSLQLVKAVVEAVAQGRAKGEARDFARGLRDTPALCDSGYMCYYREAGSTGR